jgi:hypothetical protein
MTLPSWIMRVIEADILTQRGRYTTKHCGIYKHIALVFRGRKLLSIGQNRIGRRGPYSMIHAECDAIRSLNSLSDMRNALLVVIRLGPRSLLNSKPCRTCSDYIEKCQREHGLRRCIHS